MLQQTLAIIRNTFLESVRQPIMLVLLLVATIALILSNPLSAFTMANDQRMYIDLGLATVFLCGALLAAFIATNVLGREIENRTALTVISKPVSRPLFVLGKYIGVAAALTVGTFYMSFVFLLVEQHTVLQTVRDPLHVPVILFSLTAAIIGLGTGIWCNYFYGKVFSSTVICVTTPLAALAYFFSLMFRPDFSMQPLSQGFKPQLWLALAGLLIAILILSAIAVTVSTRLGQVMTLCLTVGIFLLGMLSDWIFKVNLINPLERQWLDRARAENLTEFVDQTQVVRMATGEVQTIVNRVEVATTPLLDFASGFEKFEYALSWIGYSIVPNFQAFWLSDALTQGHLIPTFHVGFTALYGLCYIAAALSLAVFMFQRREVG